MRFLKLIRLHLSLSDSLIYNPFSYKYLMASYTAGWTSLPASLSLHILSQQVKLRLGSFLDASFDTT